MKDTNPDSDERGLQIVVDEEPEEKWDPGAEKILVQELHRLSELASED